ncbi:MAG TPA: hypothetical protein VFG38_07190 [Pseudomonadales bacterium]|nr:hypothetical protein [Pseudomonadales bacterium]
MIEELYVISFEEVLYGSILLALTMAIHGAGMLATLRVNDTLHERFRDSQSFMVGVGIIILASWVMLLTSLVEVIVWAAFFVLKHAQPGHGVAIYNSLLNYTELQAGYLPQRWHLLEGLLGLAGLMTMAWSAGTLYALVDVFQKQQLATFALRRHKNSGQQ